MFKEQIEKGLRRKHEFEGVEKSQEKPSVVSNVGTQTLEMPKNIAKKDANKIENYEESSEGETNKKKNERFEKSEAKTDGPYRYAKIFDDKPLEIKRKNKLAILLSAVTKEPPVLIPYEKSNVTSSEPEHTTLSSPAPKLVSILSPQNKPKHDKHVTFNLPPANNGDSTESTASSSKEITSDETSATTLIATPVKFKVNTNIVTLETPKSTLSMPTVTKLDFGVNNTNIIAKEKESISMPNTSTAEIKSIEETQSSGFSFKPLAQINVTTAASTGTFPFGAQSTVTTSSNISTSISTLPLPKDISSKSGGFKFDLNKTQMDSVTTKSNTTLTNTPQLSFDTNQLATPISSASEFNTQSTVSNALSLPQATASMPAFSFGVNKSTPSSQNNLSLPVLSFGASSSTTPSTNVTSPIFSMANTTNAAKTTVTSSPNVLNFSSTLQGFNNVSNNLGQSALPSTLAATSTVTSPPFNISNSVPFGTAPSGPVPDTFVTPSFGQASNSNFGASSSDQLPSSTFGTQITNSTFGSQPAGQVSNSAFGGQPSGQIPNTAFGNAITTPSSFSLNSFANTTTTSVPGFGNAAPPAFTQANTNSLGFGAPKSIPSFGTVTTASVFGTSTTTSFTSSGFGNTAPNAPIFGSSATTEPSFNANSTTAALFGSNNQNQSFNTSSTTSGFGSTIGSKPFTFGSNSNSNSNNNTIFKTAVTQPTFNFTAPATSTVTAFNTKTIPSFGSTFTTANAFGSPVPPSTTNAVTTASIFSSQTSTFGNTVPQFGTKPENTFATKSESAFGAKPENTFGSKSENTFGAKPENTFGAKPENTFGAKPEHAFGAKPENTFNTFNNSFGSSGNAPPAFGSNTNNTNVFGTTSSGFGANSNNTFGTSGTTNNAFGANQSNAGAFGTPPASNIFGANTTVNNNFGTTNAFGHSSNAPTFGFNSGDTNSAFVKSQTTGGVFGNSGAGDTTFQYGSNVAANSTFGAASSTNTAAGGQANIFAFGANKPPTTTPATGVFAFGTPEEKPSFNFNPGSNATPAFGAGAPFNTASTPNFNPGASQFGATTGAGGFSIGSGASTGNRSRTQLRAKRRV